MILHLPSDKACYRAEKLTCVLKDEGRLVGAGLRVLPRLQQEAVWAPLLVHRILQPKLNSLR